MNKIFDIEKIRRNRSYAIQHMNGHDFLFEKSASRLIDSLNDIKREFNDILIIGNRGSQYLMDYFGDDKNITIYDVTDNGDEIPMFDQGQFDCIIAMPYLHVVNDVVGFLIKIKSYLKPDGLFLCSFFGGQTLSQLRQSIMETQLDQTGGASQCIHPMIDHYQFAGLLQRVGFALPVVDYDSVNVTYSKLDSLYNDLRCMGEGNALIDQTVDFNKMKQHVENKYKKSFYNNGFETTFDILFGIGWAPHESQQQPAKRGSGQVSLTEIL